MPFGGGGARIDGLENGYSLQGKIAISSTAFFQGLMNGDVQVVLNAQRDQEHVILDDMQYWMNDQVGKDFQLMMRFPKGQLLDPANPALAKKVEGWLREKLLTADQRPMEMTITTNADSGDPFQGILSQPFTTLDKLGRDLSASLKTKNLPERVKQNIFTNAMMALGLMATVRQDEAFKSDDVKAVANVIFDGAFEQEPDSLDVAKLLVATENGLTTPEANDLRKQYKRKATHILSNMLANRNRNMPVSPDRAPTDSELKTMYGLLQEIASYLAAEKLTKADVEAILSLFMPSGSDHPNIRVHKLKCLAAIDVFFEKVNGGKRLEVEWSGIQTGYRTTAEYRETRAFLEEGVVPKSKASLSQKLYAGKQRWELFTMDGGKNLQSAFEGLAKKGAVK